MNRHLLELRDLRIIHIAEIKGKEVFYTINKDFIDVSKIAICEYMDSLLGTE